MPGPPPRKPTPPPGAFSASDADADEATSDETDEASQDEREDRRFGDFVRRAVSAGFGAASRSKDDILRIAAGEIRAWLDHLDLDRELVKALSRMSIEVKAEIRFRPDQDGKLQPEPGKTEVKLRGAGEPGKGGNGEP